MLACKILISLRRHHNYKAESLSLDFSSILTTSTQRTEKVQDHPGEHGGPDYSQSPASTK
jgi:hypothetical protein